MNEFGLQGGDPRASTSAFIDLSSCVNRYGPPASVRAFLHDFDVESLRGHPYEAADQLCELYASQADARREEFICGRGTTEFIFRVPALLGGRQLALVHPYYTEFARVAKSSGINFDVITAATDSEMIDAISSKLSEGCVVLMSNPSNPTGEYFDREYLVDAAKRGRSANGLLLVDESYIEFLASGVNSLIGANADNIGVMRSPSKFFGIAATRAGVFWTRSDELRKQIAPDPLTWPVSGIDVAVCKVAMADIEFATISREQLERDRRAMESFIERVSGERPTHRSMVNFSFYGEEIGRQVLKKLRELGIASRLLSRGHGFVNPACRVAAPTAKELMAIENHAAAIIDQKKVAFDAHH